MVTLLGLLLPGWWGRASSLPNVARTVLSSISDGLPNGSSSNHGYSRGASSWENTFARHEVRCLISDREVAQSKHIMGNVGRAEIGMFPQGMTNYKKMMFRSRCNSASKDPAIALVLSVLLGFLGVDSF